VPPPALVDREARSLPVPIAGLRPVRRSRRRHATLRLWRSRGRQLLTVIGLLLAAAAAAVTLTRPPLSVYAEGGVIHLQGSLLLPAASPDVPAGDRLYTGAATLLLVPGRGGAIVAAAVTVLDGQHVSGLCDFGPPSAVQVAERCTLRIGRHAVTCDDVLRFAEAGTWQRRCSDGQSLVVSVPKGGTVVPMPFPLGR
jgi:hypothetical protein